MTDLSKLTHAELMAKNAQDKKAIEEAPDRISRLMAAWASQAYTTWMAQA